MIVIHQGIVLTGHISEGAAALTATEAFPGLELLVQPVGLRSLKGGGVEYVQDLSNDL